MRVKCVICDALNNLDEELPLTKKLRNRPIHTYMCSLCNERIGKKTEERIASGKFRFYRDSPKSAEDYL